MRRSLPAAVGGPAALVAVAAFASGCAGGRDMGARLANAAVPTHLPLVMACWEKEFEASGFHGEYKATVDFVVAKDTSQIRQAKVRKLDVSGAEEARDASAFRACLEDALDRTVLPQTDDANGPGFATSADLTVKGYLIAFVDGSSKAREDAAERAEHVLLGPRADRCQGLYVYDPPRDEVDLYTAIGQAETSATQAKAQPDHYARALQKAYDLRLELRDRLQREVTTTDLPEANRKRLRSAIDETEAKARAIGAAIGCKQP